MATADRHHHHRREHRNTKHPNFRVDGQLYLVRCFACNSMGTENYGALVAAGTCAWCGWSEAELLPPTSYHPPPPLTRGGCTGELAEDGEWEDTFDV